LSFHPVSPEGTVEVTTSFKYFRKRLLQGVREHTDRNMSEHRKSLEKGNAFADLVEIQRRLRSHRKQNDKGTGRECRGSGDGMYVQETCRNTGNPPRKTTSPKPAPREGQAGRRWVADRPVVVKKRLTPAEQRGLSSSAAIKEGTDRGLAQAYQPRTVWELQQSLHVKAQPSGGESMKACPKAGCGKFARPV
jgi:hypothetical protein